tara:strand:- start:51 stop:1331 length:1281 start_codon:yes stop_codon:yes gene_type:complete
MKKVLIISYYWPPSGGSGVQRWLKFAKYLPKFNWKPIIYTPENPYFDLMDNSLVAEIPNEVEVVKTKIWEPYYLKDKIFGKSKNSQTSGLINNTFSLKNYFFNWIRGNFFVPDPKIFWVKKSIKFLLKYINKNNIEYIVSTGPPHSMHLIALALKKKNKNLKWIADFRDPWSKLDLLDNFHLSYFAKNKNKLLEKNVLFKANLILTVSEKWKDDFKKLGAKNVKVITNGYDDSDFTNYKSNTSKEKFVIGHYGLINHLRNPNNFWKALDEICLKNKDFSKKLEIHLSGNIDKNIIKEISNYSAINRKIKMLGYLSHKDVINAYSNTSLLLVLLFNSKSGLGNHPAKLFECIACKKQFFVFGPENSDTQKLLNKTKIGEYLLYSDNIENLKEKIIKAYNNQSVNYKFSNVFSREKLTLDLAEILNKI